MYKKFVSSLVIAVVLTFASAPLNAAVGGSNPTPQARAVGGSNPTPQAVGGSNPTPQVAQTGFLFYVGAILGAFGF
jgi:hypothetical protein